MELSIAVTIALAPAGAAGSALSRARLPGAGEVEIERTGASQMQFTSSQQH